MINQQTEQQLKTDLETRRFSRGHNYDFDVNIRLVGGLESIIIENSIFEKTLSIDFNDSIEIKFVDCDLKGGFNSKNSNYDPKKLILANTKIKSISSIANNFPIDLHNNSVIKNLNWAARINVIDSNINRLINSGIIDSDNGRFGRVSIITSEIYCRNKSTIENLSIEAITGQIELRDCVIQNITFKSLDQLSGLIADCIITSISFENMQTTQELSFSVIKNTTIFRLINSNLLGIRFFRCDFSNLKIQTSDGSMKEVIIDSIKWPKFPFINIARNPDTKKSRILRKDDQLEVRDLYRHLKIVSSNQQDKINELKFTAFEMNAYNKYLSIFKKPFDKINICISMITNYYGLNWIFPILWYLGISVLFYSILFNLNVENINSVNSPYCLEDFGRLLNPTHNIDNFSSLKLDNAGLIIIDFVGRIFQGLFVYQTISAFRKFFK